MRGPAGLTAIVAAGALLVGCSDGAERACTLVGGVDRVEVSIPEPLLDRGGSLTLRLCQDDRCWSQVERLRPDPRHVVRSVTVDFPGLMGSDIVAGDAVVSGDLALTDGTRVARLPRTPIELDAYYPNGRECDGAGFITGQVSFAAADRVGRARG